MLQFLAVQLPQCCGGRTKWCFVRRGCRNIADMNHSDHGISRSDVLEGLVTTRLLLRVALAWAGTAGCVFAAAPAAYAHDELVGSDPADGAIVSVLPRLITLHFEEPPVAGYTQVRVAGPSGIFVNSAAATTNGSDVSISIQQVSARGLYTVSFHILSDDGHAVSGAIHFTVGLATRRSTSTTAGGSKSTSLAGVVDVSLVAAVGAVATAIVTRRRRRTLSLTADEPSPR